MAIYNNYTTWSKDDGSEVFGFDNTTASGLLSITSYITFSADLNFDLATGLGTAKIYRGTADRSNPAVAELSFSLLSTSLTYKTYQASYTFDLEEWLEYRQDGYPYVTVWVSNGKTDANALYKQINLRFDLYPTISDVSIQSNFSDTSVYIEGVTSVSYSATIEGVYDATISSAFGRKSNSNYVALTEASSVWSGTGAILTDTGSVTLGIRATDNYGVSAKSATKNITVLSHSNPTITTNIFRCDANGDADADGGYLSVTAYASSVPAALGIASLYVEGRITGASSTIIAEYITPGQTYIYGNGAIDASSNYSFEFTAVDSSATYGGTALSTTVTVGVPKVVRVLNVKDGGTGLAFGKLATEDGMVDTGWIYRTGKSGSLNHAGVQVRHSVAGADTEVLARRDDTGNGVSLLVGSGGVNRGLYNRSDINPGWLLHYDGTKLVLDKDLLTLSVSNTISNSVSAPVYRISDAPSANAEYGRIYLAYENYGGRLKFREYSGSSSARTSYREEYVLPAPDASRTSNAQYNIITTKNLTDIPDASASERGLVNTETQNFAGFKTFLGRVFIQNRATYPGINFKPSYATNNGDDNYGPISIFAGSGNSSATNSIGMFFRLYSPTSTTGTTFTSNYEQYSLPPVDIGRTSRAAYSILTTKSPVTIAQGGTGQTGTTAAWIESTTLNIRKWGKVVVLDFNGFVPTSSTFTTLATDYRPSVAAHGICRWKNTSNQYYPALITVGINGVVSASYWNGTTASAISNGTLAGEVTWIQN